MGYKVEITGNFYIMQKAGLGTTFIIGNKDEILTDSYNKYFEWAFATLLSIGVGYSFK